MNRFLVWLKNARHFHERLMMAYLRKRGWVVFYLDPQARQCNAVCWMKEYVQAEDR